MARSALEVVSLIDLVGAINIFRPRNNPGYSLFLGAGASKTSGLPLASELIHSALLDPYTQAEGAPPATESYAQVNVRLLAWMKSQKWYHERENLYSVVMEEVLNNPGIRQEFLKREFRNARPSLGYRRLGDLLQARVFDTVFTTNFDRLVPQGAYGQAVRTVMRLEDYSSSRLHPSPAEPRLIRLHGDFYHNDVLNTEGELEQTPKKRFQAATRLCLDSGMIVIGYSGNDRKLMVELFHKNIRKPSFLRNGLYWCLRAGTPIPNMVQTLADIPDPNHRRVNIVYIESFDDAIDTIANKLGVQDWLGDYEAAHQAQTIYKELLDLLFSSGNPDPGADAGRILSEMASQIKTSEAYFVGTFNGRVTVISATSLAAATEPDRLSDVLFKNTVPIRKVAKEQLEGPDLPLANAANSEYQIISVSRNGAPLGALVTPSLPRARDSDDFLMSVTARMLSLIHAEVLQ